MSNPLDDVVTLAVGLWRRTADKFAAEWSYMFNFYYQNNFSTAIIDAFTDLSVLLEFASALSAVSDSDNVQIGRDATWGTIENFRHLAWPVLPRWGSLAAEWADRVALIRALQAEQWAWERIVHEAKDRAIGDLRERLALDVAIAQEHADMVTRIAIETNDRVAMVVHEAKDRALGDAQVRQDLTALITKDVNQLDALIAQLSAYAHSLPGLVDTEAVNGYNPTLRARAGTLQRLIDTLAAHDPFVAGVIKDLATVLIDLAEVEDPVLRLAAQFVLRQIIDHLGLDTALRDLAGELLGGILGAGPPKTLTGVTAAVGDRLNAVEESLSVLSPLAGEADDLHELGTLAFDAALLAYLATGVTNPRAWADDTNAVLHATVDQLLNPLLRLLGAP